ncbi:DUF1906 domain-containing protein, partial [Kitasatospora sp. NPDC001175]
MFSIPTSWSVFDLTANPSTCVRFDQHALYLGTPGKDQQCPPRLIGRTEALLVEPATTPAAAQGTTDNSVAHELDAAAGDIKVTATYGEDKSLVSGILAKAALPTGSPKQPRTVTAANANPAGAAAVASVSASVTNYVGKGFEACTAPGSDAMDAWLSNSPYRAVGIYIGGPSRSCGQLNLTASWVQQQAAAGWHFMPLYAGAMAEKISSPDSEGTAAADDAVNQAQSLGLGVGSVLYEDMESYTSAYSANVLGYLSAWTKELHARGYVSAVYSSSSSGISDLVRNLGGSYAMPDVVFDANWNGVADTNDPILPGGAWASHQRVHQYSGDVKETWGGVEIWIDRDYLDVAVAAPTSEQYPLFTGSAVTDKAGTVHVFRINQSDGH